MRSGGDFVYPTLKRTQVADDARSIGDDVLREHHALNRARLDAVHERLEELGVSHQTGIALTGFGMEEDIKKSRQSGFVEHLTKPINLQQLRSAIERVMHGGTDVVVEV